MTVPDATTPVTPTWRMMCSHPCHIISLGFGSGLSPIMPGTAGTLLGSILFHYLTLALPTVFTQLTWAVITAIGFVLGCWTCHRTGIALRHPDHGAIVWDEVIGIWLVLLAVMPVTLSDEIMAFVFFRLFDMTKPPPIRQIDARVKGGVGVMLDDIAAALFAIPVLLAWNYVVPFFSGQPS
ncbi:MAG: phosphatidylglycerophosphatase A [Burkholderiaceae bacterium]|jgi:phosphatidylglycerophosphatase A|nr:phosphatidylglycerophosphatase A [Burkholderiaceae bacterium]